MTGDDLDARILRGLPYLGFDAGPGIDNGGDIQTRSGQFGGGRINTVMITGYDYFLSRDDAKAACQALHRGE